MNLLGDVWLSTFPRKCVCLREHGGNFEKCEVICVDYGVWGLRGDPNRIQGGGGSAPYPPNFTYPPHICYLIVTDTLVRILKEK